MSRINTKYGQGNQLEQYLLSLDNNDSNVNKVVENGTLDPISNTSARFLSIVNEISNIIINLMIDVFINTIYKQCPSLQYQHQHHHHHHSRDHDYLNKYNIIVIMIIIILLVVTVLILANLSKLLLLITFIMLMISILPTIIGYYCSLIISNLIRFLQKVDYMSNELLTILKKFQLIRMGKTLTHPLPCIYQESIIETKELSFKNLRNSMFILMTNTMKDIITLTNDIINSDNKCLLDNYDNNSFITSKQLRQLRKELLSSISFAINNTMIIITTNTSGSTYEKLNRLVVFIYYIRYLNIFLNRHYDGLNEIYKLYFLKPKDLEKCNDHQSNIEANSDKIRSHLNAVRMKSETLMYRCLVSENDLFNNYIQNISNNNNDIKEKLELLLTMLDDVQVNDIPKLKEEIKNFLNSLDFNNNDSTSNKLNDDVTKNDRIDVIYNNTEDIHDTNQSGINEKVIIESNDIYNDQDNKPIIDNDNSNKIIEIYVATIPRNASSKNKDIINESDNVSKYNPLLMNELHDALQLISFTERINQFDDEHNQDQGDNNIDEYNNNNDNFNDIKWQLPTQLKPEVTLDLLGALSNFRINNEQVIIDENDDI